MDFDRLSARRPSRSEPHAERLADSSVAGAACDCADSETDAADDPDRVRRRIRRRAERIERDEVDEAISKLEARGGLTDEQRETVRRLGSVLARRITTGPESTLTRISRNDRATVCTVAKLFDVESE